MTKNDEEIHQVANNYGTSLIKTMLVLVGLP